jgi:hypothetical protein
MNARKVFLVFFLLFGNSNAKFINYGNKPLIETKMVEFVCENITKVHSNVRSLAILIFDNNFDENIANEVGKCANLPFVVLDLRNFNGKDNYNKFLSVKLKNVS